MSLLSHNEAAPKLPSCLVFLNNVSHCNFLGIMQVPIISISLHCLITMFNVLEKSTRHFHQNLHLHTHWHGFTRYSPHSRNPRIWILCSSITCHVKPPPPPLVCSSTCFETKSLGMSGTGFYWARYPSSHPTTSDKPLREHPNMTNRYDWKQSQHTYVYGALIMTKAIARVHLVQCRLSAGWPPTLRASQLTWAVSLPINGCYHPHPPLPFVIITRPLSRAKHVKPVSYTHLTLPTILRV